jgi:hypothetical protein
MTTKKNKLFSQNKQKKKGGGGAKREEGKGEMCACLCTFNLKIAAAVIFSKREEEKTNTS